MSEPVSPAQSYVEATPSSPFQPGYPLDQSVDDAIDCTLPSPIWTRAPDIEPPHSPVSLQPITSPTHSRAAQALLGSVIPDNTRKANMVALKALSVFCVKQFRPHRSHLIELDDVDQLLFESRCFVFPDGQGRYLPAGFSEWTDAQLEHIRFHLIEFVATYKNKKTGKDLAPTTLKTYVLGLQRGFVMEWGYKLNLLQGPIFNCPSRGFMSVIKNKAREQQRAGNHVISHNVLSREDLLHLYRSQSLSKDTPRGFQTRLIFTIGIVTGMRPTSLSTLTIAQFRKTKIREDNVWVVSGAIGSACGASKTSKGGWRAIGEKVQEVCVWDESYDNGEINFFQDIDEYMAIRLSMEIGTDRFFLACHGQATHRQDFFKRQHLGKNSFMNAVKNACITEGIEGSGQKNWVTTHGLRRTLATLLFENGHSDSSVAMRTGHRDPRSLKSYQHLRGKEGLQQQHDILGKENKEEQEKKRAKVNIAGMESENKDVYSGSRMPLTSIGTINGGTVNVTVHYCSSDANEGCLQEKK